MRKGEAHGLPVPGKSDHHCIMPGGGLRPVRAEQAVPPGEIEAEIAVGLPDDHRMVDAVHVGGDDKKSEHCVEPGSDADVAVIEHARAVKDYLKEKHRGNGGAEEEHHTDLDAHGKDYLDRMETKAGGDIHLGVSMVHFVEPPEDGNKVERGVLCVYGEVEEQGSCYDCGPARETDPIEEP